MSFYRTHALTVATIAAVVFGSSASVSGQTFTTVDISAFDNYASSILNPAYPGGRVTLGGVPFQIGTVAGTGNNIWNSGSVPGFGSGTVSLTVPINKSGVSAVQTLINSGWGQPGPNYYTSLLFTYSDGTTYTKPLIGNVDIRDWNVTYTTKINNTTSTQVFSAFNPNYNNTSVLDKQYVDLSTYASKTLVSMTVLDNGAQAFQATQLSAVTLQFGGTAATPEPNSATNFFLALSTFAGAVLLRRKYRKA